MTASTLKLFTSKNFHSWLFNSILIVGELIENKGTTNSKSSLRKMLLSLSLSAPLLKLPSIYRIISKKFALSMIVILMKSSLIFLVLFNNLEYALFFSLTKLTLIYNIIQEINLYTISMFLLLLHLSIINFMSWWKYKESFMFTCLSYLLSIICTISVLFYQRNW